MASKIRKIVKNVSAAAALLIMLWRLVDGNQIYASAESEKNLATGKTVQLHVHGRDLFVTPEQGERLNPFHWTSGLFVVLLAATVIARREP